MADGTKKGRDFEGATPERLARALLRPNRQRTRGNKDSPPPRERKSR